MRINNIKILVIIIKKNKNKKFGWLVSQSKSGQRPYNKNKTHYLLNHNPLASSSTPIVDCDSCTEAFLATNSTILLITGKFNQAGT